MLKAALLRCVWPQHLAAVLTALLTLTSSMCTMATNVVLPIAALLQDLVHMSKRDRTGSSRPFATCKVVAWRCRRTSSCFGPVRCRHSSQDAAVSPPAGRGWRARGAPAACEPAAGCCRGAPLAIPVASPLQQSPPGCRRHSRRYRCRRRARPGAVGRARWRRTGGADRRPRCCCLQQRCGTIMSWLKLLMHGQIPLPSRPQDLHLTLTSFRSQPA